MENNPLSIKETSLLTLSKRDFVTKKKSSTANEDDDELVLMQMPSSLTVRDLKGAHINASANKQACLVLENSTYSLSRVETSNAYVLVPPQSSQQEDRPRKRVKTNNSGNTSLVSVPARLLQSGGSGASFIELKELNLNLADLSEQLKDCILDPFGENKKDWRGKSVETLANDLQCSKNQVLNGLKRIQALSITTKDGNTAFGLLSEEGLKEAQVSIVATLMECDEFADYAGTGISLQDCVAQVMKRIPTSEQYEYMKQVIQHTLGTLQADDDDSNSSLDDDDDKIQLDVKKVAVCVVHGLFTKQSDPWDEQELLSEWQREMPGVGQAYQVSLDMLAGVALQCDTTKYKYFPELKLPTSLQERFELLFQQRDKWTLEELSPYVKRFTTKELSKADLLVKYTNFVTETIDSVPTKLFVKK